MNVKKVLTFLLLITIASKVWSGPIYQNISTQWNQILASSPVGQTFTAEDPNITFGFFIGDGNSSFGLHDYSVDYFLYEGIGVNGFLLSSKTFINLSDGYHDYATVDFSDINLSIGSLYTVIISNDNQRWDIYIAGHNTYNSGTMIFNGEPFSFCDARFRIDPVSHSVPEPSLFLLICVSLMCLACVYCKNSYQTENVNQV